MDIGFEFPQSNSGKLFVCCETAITYIIEHLKQNNKHQNYTN